MWIPLSCEYSYQCLTAIDTVITASPSSSGEDLWLKLKLADLVQAVPLRGRGVDIDGTSLLMMARTNSNSVTHLSGDVNEVLTDLIRVQWRIKQMLPKFLGKMMKKYERHIIVFADLVQRHRILRVAFKPRWFFLVGKGLVLLVLIKPLSVANILTQSRPQIVNGSMSSLKTSTVSPNL